MLTLYRLTITIKSSYKLLNDAEYLLPICKEVAKLAGLKVIKEDYFKLSPQGVIVYLLLKQSHLALHTWPEQGLGYIDILSSKEIKEDKVKDIKEILKAVSLDVVNSNLSLEPLEPNPATP